MKKAVKIVLRSGRIPRHYFHSSLQIDWKEDHSPVTEADRETEQWLMKTLRKNFPHIACAGEEYGMASYSEDAPCWIIDPIDGTKSFIAGVPLYTTLLALVYKKEPLIGIIHAPSTGETVAATKNLGCYYNGIRTRVRETENFKEAWVMSTDWGALYKKAPTSMSMYHNAGLTRSWGDAYGYLLLASGRADVMIDPEMNIWDLAPLYPIVREAGGVISDFHGQESMYTQSAVAAVNPKLHRETCLQMGIDYSSFSSPSFQDSTSENVISINHDAINHDTEE